MSPSTSPLPSCEICTVVISSLPRGGKNPRTCGHPDCIREHKRRYKAELRREIREVNVYTRGGEDELDRKMNEFFKIKGWDN